MELIIIVMVLFGFWLIDKAVDSIFFFFEWRKRDLKGVAIDWSAVKYEANRLEIAEHEGSRSFRVG